MDCKFCHESFNEGCNDSLIEDKLKVFNSEEMFIGVDVFVEDDQLELYLDDPAGYPLIKRKIKINYCPICGRKIEEVRDE